MQLDDKTKPWTFAAGSPGRQRVMDLAKKVAPSNCPVLILGPTGVGKEVLAEDIHCHSARSLGRFVAINCASLTPSLFESELFGHHRGAYTGAFAHKVGLVELADLGTLFLDEVSELTLEIQAKLLRFLSRGTFWPLGSTEERAADVRVIAAANRDLRKMIPQGFREDLFYRLSVVPLILPMLEPEDSRLICVDLVHDISHRLQCTFSAREMNTLSQLAGCVNWPGGVRELRNVLERYFLLREFASTVEDTWALSRALSAVELHDPRSSPALQISPAGNTGEILRHFEDLVFLNLASEAQGVRDLADRLGRTPQAVYDRLKKLGLSPDGLQGHELRSKLSEVRRALVPYQRWIQALLNA